MNLYKTDIEPGYFQKVGDNLFQANLFSYNTDVIFINPTLYSKNTGQITTRSAQQAAMVTVNSNLSVPAAEYADSVWAGAGWNLNNIDAEFDTFAQSNLTNCNDQHMNWYIIRKTIDSIPYTVIFTFPGNASKSSGFGYLNFASTEGLNLVSTNRIQDNFIYLTDTSAGDVGNVWLVDAATYNKSFSLALNFECSGGSGADGFCVQWYDQNNVNGGTGGGVGYVDDPDAIHAILFPTWFGIGGSQVKWLKNNVQQASASSALSFRQNVYYWMDYDHAAQTMKVYYSTSNSKPGSAAHTFSSFLFDSNEYYFGVGAATGGSTDNHILKSMSLSF